MNRSESVVLVNKKRKVFQTGLNNKYNEHKLGN